MLPFFVCHGRIWANVGFLLRTADVPPECRVMADGSLCVENKKANSCERVCFSGELAGARTRDPNIKSVVLYLLSYEFIVTNFNA